MSVVQGKKHEICELWGLSISEIDSKLAILQSIICNESDCVLLDYLLKADLSIDQAMNLHFGGNTPSPSPPLNSNNMNNNNNNHRNNNSIIDKTPSLDEHANLNNIADDDDESNYDNDDIDDEEENDNMLLLNTNNNRKRKRDVTDDDIDMNIPTNKRRKIDIDNENVGSDAENTNNSNSNNSKSNNNTNSNTNNHNHNSSMKMEQDCDEDIEDTDSKININDTNWKTKLIGTLKVEYTQKRPCSMKCIKDLHLNIVQKNINIENLGVVSHLKDKRRVNKLYRDCIYELCYKAGGISVKLKNSEYIEGSAVEMEIYENKYNEMVQEEREKKEKFRQFAWMRMDDWNCQQRARRKIVKPGRFIMEYEVTFTRYKISITSFSVNMPYTMALFGGSRQLLDKNMNVIKIEDKYKKNKHVQSMVSLLDFACRDKYKINEMNNNESYNHGLNVKLHEYQLQSLDFMITEENHPIGFYRHFYEKGRFNDNTPFQYSPTFKNLIVNQRLPVVHGGFLCEEMGLGKTIISLALINCNKPTDLAGYSTNNILKIAHSEIKEKSREEIVSMIRLQQYGTYNVQYTWYKSKATLIIAPVSLVGQWEKECDEKSIKEIKYKRYYGSRSRDIGKYIDKDIVFTTYGILGQENGDDRKKHVLHQIEWHRIILDESHYVKNGNCKTSRSINELRGINKWCLTGTPFGTQIYDIYNQLKFLGLQRVHLDALHLQSISKYKLFDGGKAELWMNIKCNGLMHIIQSMVMRHTKSQKFNDKPIVRMSEKEEDVIFIDFTTKQKEYYDKLYNTAKERFNYYKSTGNIGRGTISILSSLHPARQACSGCIYSKDNIEQQLSDAQAKTFRVRSMIKENANYNLSRQELFEMAKLEAFNNTDGECPICYECPFDEPLQTPCRHIFCGECITSILQNKSECPMCRKKVKILQLKKPPSKQQQQQIENDNIKHNHNQKMEEDEEKNNNNNDEIRFDSKLKVLINELKKIREKGQNEKALIFTSFSKSLNWMCNELKMNGFEYRTLTGSMSMNKRKKQLDEFSNNINVNVFVLTVRSGAVGITLTAANHVFMLEPPFNAALHRQAINRVYRLGQKKKVFIHTLIMKNSIEEKIWNINKHKQNDNNSPSKINNNNNNLAGNISRDKSAKLQQHEISKLFQ